ncbi:MAG: beta strand repeat-containing protein, partial [Verrucomicrobiota bacterium]
INANLPNLIDGVVFDNGAGRIQLTHSGQETMTWTGASGGSWDTSSTNFSGTVTGPDSFRQGDVVVFDSTKSPVETAVTVAGSGVTPASVSINDTAGSFTFSGGSINGGGGITKTGAGKTVMATDNTNTGTTTISAGTLQIGNGGTKGNLGSGSVVNDGTLAVNKSSQTVLTGAISGTGVLRNDGTGRTILPRDNSYAGGTVISKGPMEGRTAAAFGTGSITLGDASTGASDVALLFNPFNNDAAITVANPIVVAAGGTGRVTIGSGESSNVGAGLIFSAASTLTLNRDVTLTGDLDRTTWEGVISGTVDTINIAPSPALDATLRPGRVSWSGANTFTPATAPFTTINVLDRAIFQLGQATTSAAIDQVPDTAAVVVAAGGTLQFGIANDSETIGDLSGAGTVRNITNTALNLTFGTSRDTEFSGVLNGGNALSFIKQGSGTFTMSGNLDNSSGNVTVNAGTVLLAKNSTPFVHALGAASTVNAGGTLKLGGTWTYTRPESDGRAGVNSAPSNAPANYVDQVYNGSGLTINAGGVLDMNGRSEAVNTLAGAGTVTNSGGVPSMLYIGANNGDSTFTGLLEDGTGGLGVVKMGTGVMTLSGASTYSGVTEIRSDNVTITDLQALGSAVGGTIIGANRDNSGATDIPSLTINVTTASTLEAPNILAEPLTLRSETAGDQRSQVVNSAQTTRLTGPIVLEGDGISQFVASQAAGSQFQINGGITGTSNGILFLRGAGELQLNSVINAPALQVAKTEGSLLILNSTGNDYLDISLVHGTTRTDVPNAIDPTAILRMGQNGNDNTLDLNGNNQTVAGIRLNFGFSDARNRLVTNLSATPATLTINTPNALGADMNYGAPGLGGTIAGNLSLVKDGPGTQVLSAANSYTGTTTVNGGTLRIDGSITSAATVNRNATLAGLGTVGTVDVTDGGKLRPSGILTTGAVTTRVGGLVEFSIGGTTAGTQYTRLNTIGAINVDSSTLVVSLTNGFVPAQFDAFTLWANDDTDPFAGTFDGLLEGSLLPVAGTSGTADLDADYWRVSYTGETGNDFVLTYVPEPGTAALLLAGGLPLLRRRRRAA